MLRIDAELKKVVPPLTADEFNQLEKNILDEGCREPLVVWDGVIVDGHNRYEICTNNGLDFDTVEKEFEGLDEAKVWIIDNQKGRRNLTDGWKYELAQERKKILLVKGTENKAHGQTAPGKTLLSISDKSDRHNTQKEIASELGWSTGKTAQADYVWKHGDEKIKEKIKQGEESFNSAYKVISKENRTKEIAEERQKIAESAKAISNTDRWNIHQADIKTWQTERQYDYIITDPPYPKEFLPLYEVLAERANEWLKPGGLLVAMCGQSYLNQIYEMMSNHLEYYWTACYYTPGQPTPLRQVNVNTTWKPLLMFKRRGDDYKGRIFGDVFASDANDKDFHKWGQSVSGMNSIVGNICLNGQYILDPFCGAGTTGIAALSHGCLFDGLDIEEDNVNISRCRLKDVVLV